MPDSFLEEWRGSGKDCLVPTDLLAHGSSTDGTPFGHVLGGHLRRVVVEAAVSPHLSPDPFLFGHLPSPVVGNGEPDSVPPVKGIATMHEMVFDLPLRVVSSTKSLVGVNILGKDGKLWKTL